MDLTFGFTITFSITIPKEAFGLLAIPAIYNSNPRPF